jgi:2-dehydro-3-deoxyphosphogluconate aldolase / (4S)-4-hydroxy-2-oxoglutarate aldolase
MNRSADNEIQVFDRLSSACIIAVLVIDRATDAVPVAEALVAGGVRAIELTLRTPAAFEALRKIRRFVPDMLAGVGTVLRPDQVTQAVDAGAEFGVAPGSNPRVMESALRAGLPFAPGICTPSDIEQALQYERRFLKFFPAEPSGGLAFLRFMAAPYAHLGLKYLPLGGITISNMADYLREPFVGAIGGSWFAPREVIAASEWTRITAAAREASAIRDNERKTTATGS